MTESHLRRSDGGWYVCHECGIHRRVPEGASTICEINGAGAPMESISEAVAHLLSMGDKRIVELWDERDRLRNWVDTEGRNCPSKASVDAVLRSGS